MDALVGRIDVRKIRWFVLLLVGVVIASLMTMIAFPPEARAATPADTAGEYVPLASYLLADTRTGADGVPVGPMGAGQTISFNVLGTGGASGVPSSGVSAVVLSITAVTPTVSTYFTVYPQGATRPTVAQLTMTAGPTVANSLISKFSATGGVSLFNASGSVNVIVSVEGYYTSNTASSAGGTFVALSPQRIYDSGSGIGGSTTPIGAGETRAVQALGQGGIPLTGVSAVVVNVEIQGATAGTYDCVWGPGARTVAAVNVPAGGTSAAMVQTQVDATGHINVYNYNGSARLLIDVEGYYLTPDQNARSYFVPISTTRILSTASGLNAPVGPVTAGSTVSLPVRGVMNGSTVVVPNDGSVSAVVLSVSPQNPHAYGYLTVFPEGEANRSTEVLSYDSSTTYVTGTVIAKIGTDGRVSIYVAGGNPNLIVDVQGYFQSTRPDTPTNLSISEDASNAVGVPDPTVSARVSDPNGGSAFAEFSILDADGNEVWSGTGSTVAAAGAMSTATVDAGSISANNSYTLEVRTSDGVLESNAAASLAFDTLGGPASAAGVTVGTDGWITYNDATVQNDLDLTPGPVLVVQGTAVDGGCEFQNNASHESTGDQTITVEVGYDPQTCQERVQTTPLTTNAVTAIDSMDAAEQAQSVDMADTSSPDGSHYYSTGSPSELTGSARTAAVTASTAWTNTESIKARWIDPVGIQITALRLQLDWWWTGGLFTGKFTGHTWAWDPNFAGIHFDPTHTGTYMWHDYNKGVNYLENSLKVAFYNSTFAQIVAHELGTAGWIACGAWSSPRANFSHDLTLLGMVGGHAADNATNRKSGACTNLVHQKTTDTFFSQYPAN